MLFHQGIRETPFPHLLFGKFISVSLFVKSVLRGDDVTFDFEKFSRITASVYPVSPYTLEEALNVFHCYFEKYEEYTGRPHPPIKASQIVRICQDMPFVDRGYSGGLYADIEPEAYPALIDRYFATKYRNCDRNINHFFSGRIREMKFYEELY